MTIEKTVYGKDNWKAKVRYYLKDNDGLEILDQYNSEIRSFRNYYRIANNAAFASSFGYKTSLMARLSAGQCEVCGKTDCEIEIHHVRKLKDLKGKSDWERFMIVRNRKTLALCLDCHEKLHSGKLN